MEFYTNIYKDKNITNYSFNQVIKFLNLDQGFRSAYCRSLTLSKEKDTETLKHKFSPSKELYLSGFIYRRSYSNEIFLLALYCHYG